MTYQTIIKNCRRIVELGEAVDAGLSEIDQLILEIKGGIQPVLKRPAIRLHALVMPKLKPGTDYYVQSDKTIVPATGLPGSNIIGGFHVDVAGSVVEHSLWDPKWRPTCPDPRGMVLVGGKFWMDLYLMGRDGQSRAGNEIADGKEKLPHGYKNLNWATAKAILAKQGKTLPTREEFALAAEGVNEGQAAPGKQLQTGRIEGLTSNWGLEQATGTLWVWSSEVDGDGWPYVLGGSWHSSGDAGPRFVSNSRPDYSFDNLGVRGRSDHLTLE